MTTNSDKIATMSSDTRVFKVEVNRTLETVLDLLTRRKAFGIITVPFERASRIVKANLEKRQVESEWVSDENGVRKEMRALIAADECFYVLSKPRSESAGNELMLLFVGGPIASRDDESRKGVVKKQLESYGIKEEEVEFVPVRTLYDRTDGYSLEFSINARDEEEAILIWQGTCLNLGEDGGITMLTYDRSLMMLNLMPVGNADPENQIAADSPLQVDPAEFSTYDEIFDKVKAVAGNKDPDDHGYGDDIVVECSISDGASITRCIFHEFYSNHWWKLDPTSLLVLRVKAHILSEVASYAELSFSHPTKAAERLNDGAKYYLDSIGTDNNMEPKFRQGLPGDTEPDDIISANQHWDNLVDFFQWYNMFRQEIRLL